MVRTRRMSVLRAVVEDYIRNQEPVGSTALAKRHNLGVSSATIRNDMAVLEEEGYLIQPHTSAGRIPTEKGYRFFVDRLSSVVPLSKPQRQGIQAFLEGSVNLQDTLQRAARLLARITGQIAVVASPSLSKSTLRHVELVAISTNMLLAVVITDTGRVAQHMLQAPQMPTQHDIAAFSQIVNRIGTGRSLRDCARLIRSIHHTDLATWTQDLSNRLASALDTMADEEHASELFMSGTSTLAHSDRIHELGPLFDALEEQFVIMRLMDDLNEHQNDQGIGVAIGSETKTPGLLHAAVVSSGYGQATTSQGLTDFEAPTQQSSSSAGDDSSDDSSDENKEQGSAVQHMALDLSNANTTSPVAYIGAIGPTHMDYASTMAAVWTVARYLTAFLGEEHQ
ncbi:HrcA family transcriptional regulator [Bifidobacterium dolichotidis]|uniref:Heat-inducible transcription repressor HrcA n=1 Tax=Bifidobacterium dolichotidis TaxID=2306976 RepID=A0A430FT71_9BIFI|nr:heat-inducible transcriptional repressor HrcA [Bifidobacterium dolichotidis]RSX56060.1 HrcA family transcriptional regulator [Bifidobacterium dolichotidis]